MKYHYIYKTVCLIDGIYYIGRHSTKNLSDGYMGSGTILHKMFEIFGKENFKCEILEFVDSYEKLVEREKEIIDEALVNDLRCMNLALGGDGGWETVNKNLTPEQRTKAGKAGGYANFTYEQRSLNAKSSKCGTISLTKRWSENRELMLHQCKNALHLARTQYNEKRKEVFKEIKHQQGEKNSQFGIRFRWMSKDGIRKKCPLDEVENHLLNGWKLGRK